MYDKGKAAVVVTRADGRHGRRAAVHEHACRRSSAAKADGAATAARPARRTSRRSASPTTSSRTRRRPTRRSCTASPATATRCTPTRRSPRWAASTGRSCTVCAATASPAGRCCTRCAAAIRRNFHHIEARFAAPVMPGEALTVRMWTIGDGEVGVHDERRRPRRPVDRPRRHRPGPPAATADRRARIRCDRPASGSIRRVGWVSDAVRIRSVGADGDEVGDGVGEGDVDALAGAAVLDLDRRVALVGDAAADDDDRRDADQLGVLEPHAG